MFRIFAKYLLPFLLKYYLKRFSQKFYQQNAPMDSNRKVGETNVEFVPEKKTKNKSTDKIGEYVDFEEIKN
ncbi:MAG: hypothetical protein ACOYO1_08105 [Bacteroidales bacterium]